MKNKKSILVLMFAAAASMLLIPSCSKDNSGSIPSKDVVAAQDEVYADALYEEVDNIVVSNVATLDQSGFSTMNMKSAALDSDGCMVMMVNHPDSVSFPKVVTMDFGTGCTRIFRNDTITFKGQIIVTVTDHWFTTGSQHMVTFKNFYINDVKIEGTRTITNNGLNAKNHLEMGIVLTGGKVIFNDTAFITRESNHVREWIRSTNPMNDTMLITGTANGVNIQGQQYDRVITSPLVLVRCKDAGWRWGIVKGTIQITNSLTGVSTIDYSGTGCEGSAVLNKNGLHMNMPFMYKHHNHHRHGMMM
jgi:hypothetical protein